MTVSHETPFACLIAGAPYISAFVLARSAALVALGTLAALLTGCARTQTAPLRLDLPPETVALALDVTNFHGSVTVRADRGEPGSALVRAERFAHSGSSRRADAMVDAIGVVAEMEADGPLAVLRVNTVTNADADDPHGVNLLIHLPRCDGLRVRNNGGHVSVSDAGGSIEIINHDGSIEFRTTRRITEPVTLVTHEGEIYFQAPMDSTGVFDMLTLEGRTVLVDRGAIVSESYTGRGSLHFVLNDGQNPIVLRTNRGNLRAWVMDDPLGLTRATKRDKPDYRDRLHLEGSRRHTRNLPHDTPREDPPDISVSAQPLRR